MNTYGVGGEGIVKNKAGWVPKVMKGLKNYIFWDLGHYLVEDGKSTS